MESPAPALVLVVDDDDRNRKLACEVLRLAGFGALEAITGAAAIELAAANMPDVILMDLRLPDIDGVAAARRIRSDPRTAAIPVVALTALSIEPTAAWLREGGFSGYLAKPIDIETLPDVIRSFGTRRLR